MKTLRLISVGLMAVLMCVNFTACDPDPDPEEENNSLLKRELKNHKWHYSGYDYELYEKQMFTMFFINDTCGVTHFYYKFMDIGGVTEDDVTFTYKVNGNNVIIKYDHGGTFNYLYADGILYSDDYSEVYYPQTYTSDDYQYLKEFDPAEKERKAKILETIERNLKVVENYDGYFYKYIFDDNLDKIYPNSQIKYAICFHGVCNQYKYCKESWCDEHRWFSYAEKEGNKYIATIIPAHPNDWAEFEMYYSTMKNIEQKINNGEWVSEEHYELYEDIDGYLKEICDNNFSAYPCVVIDNEAFELEGYKF